MIPSAQPLSLADGGAERWRPVPDYPSYEVSSYGRVRRLVPYKQYPAGMLLSARPDTGGYFQVALSRDGKTRYVNSHRLVAEVFIGPPPTARHQVAHGDGDRTNNWVGNLRWATPKENCADRARHGRNADMRGERHPSARLHDDLVIELRNQRRAGRTYGELALRFCLRMNTIHDAVVGNTWSHVPGALGTPNRTRG